MSLTLLEPTTTDSMVVQCANYSKHGIPTGWFASREFKLDDDELKFMNHLSREDQRRIWKVHFDTGRCVPCMIDEWRDSNRFPSIEIPVSSGPEVVPQRRSIEKPVSSYSGYHGSKLEEAIAEKVDKIFDDGDEPSSSVVQKLIALIAAIERYLASCFSGKKTED